MKLQRLKVADLSGDPANARKHDERNIGSIVASLKRFGQQKPIVVDSSRVVRAGNGTLEAARLLGWTEIDCVVTDLKGSEATAYAVADNRTAELASWDDDVLAATLNGLLADDADLLAAAGFDEAELAELLELSGDSTPDQPPPENKYSEQYGVIVICSDEPEQERVFNELQGSGYNCRVVTTWG